MNVPKKLIIFIIIIVALIPAAIFVGPTVVNIIRTQTQPQGEAAKMKGFLIEDFTGVSDCAAKGGRFIPHGAGNTCEIIAPDAGKKCTYDSDCKKKCVYAGEGSDFGACEAYVGDEDGNTTCHRPQNGKVVCDLIFS
jgi:hypothetical protein